MKKIYTTETYSKSAAPLWFQLSATWVQRWNIKQRSKKKKPQHLRDEAGVGTEIEINAGHRVGTTFDDDDDDIFQLNK